MLFLKVILETIVMKFYKYRYKFAHIQNDREHV
jgi:hypothetical protein